jgi:hypothetical protein
MIGSQIENVLEHQGLRLKENESVERLGAGDPVKYLPVLQQTQLSSIILVGYILYPAALLNLHSLVCSESLVMFCLLD